MNIFEQIGSRHVAMGRKINKKSKFNRKEEI